MTTQAPAPIFADLAARAAAKVVAHNRKVLTEACDVLATFMDQRDIAELFVHERTDEINESWIRVWDQLDPTRQKGTVAFKANGQTYWLSRNW